MKKRIFFGLAIAALASAGFAIADNASRPTLTSSQLENLEALSDKEWSIELGFDTCCIEQEGGICITDGYSVTWNAAGVKC